MKIKHSKTLFFNENARVFFVIENDTDTAFCGDLLLELQNWLWLGLMNFDMPTKVIDARSFGSFYIDVPKRVAKKFRRFKYIWHNRNQGGLLAFEGRGKALR
jgi:hypothetical protein